MKRSINNDQKIDFRTNKGVALVVSSYYKNYNVDKRNAYEYKYILITASKNRYQYLDSFDGSTSNSLCFKKGEVLIY